MIIISLIQSKTIINKLNIDNKIIKYSITTIE